MQKFNGDKEIKKRIAVFGVMVLAVVIVLGGITYAFFGGALGSVKEQIVKSKSGTLSLTFRDLNTTPKNINKTMSLGDSVEKDLVIENTGTLDAYARIFWDDLINTYLPKSLTYTLEYKTSETGTYESVRITSKNVPTSETSSTQELANGLFIPAGETYYYKLTITFKNLSKVDQTQDLNATLSTKFSIEEGTEIKENTMIARQDYDSTELIWGHSADIKSVVFENTMIPKENTTHTYDLSEKQDNSIIAYLVPTEEDETKYKAYIQTDGIVLANKNSLYLFRDFTNLENIIGLENFDTSNVNNMNSMFYKCSKLTTLDLSNFDTSKVTNMQSMFSECSNLTTLDVSNFDTSNVTSMFCMFYNCSSLITLDVSNFDTGNVTSMSFMFDRCSSLTTLDLSNFDTCNVKSMNNMFFGCSNLSILDVSHFDTSNVTNMLNMFSGCSSLTTLDVSNFDTINVTDISYMFRNCNGLTTLDLSNFDTSNVTNMSFMFFGCSSLTSLNLLNLDVSSVTTNSVMLNSLPSSIQITVSNNDIKQWLIDASNSPKLTDSNFIVQA